MKKRFFSAFLAICMMLTILPMTAMAADPAEEVDSVFEMQDFNLVPDSNGNYNVGWHYLDGFDTDTITALEVGLKDPNGELIVKYTASGDQLTYQRQNGYINDSKQSSAPFIKNYNEIEDEDWSVVWGEDDIYAKWNVSSAYVTVTVGNQTYTLENENCAHQHSFTKEEVTEAALKTAETNESAASYYKTCPDCGAVSYNEEDVWTNWPYLLDITAPQKLYVGEDDTTTAIRLHARNGESQTVTHARIEVDVTGPEDAKPQFIAKDAQSGTKWNILDYGYFGPEAGFEVTSSYDITTQLEKVSFDKPGTYTITLKLVDKDNNDKVLAMETASVEVGYRFAFEVTAPTSMRVNEENTTTSVRLYAVEGNDKAYSNARINIEVEKPDGSNPQFIAKDEATGTEWNVLDYGYFGPEGGFPVSADYDITTNFAKVSFDQTGTYTVTLKLVDRNNGDAVLAETTNTIQVTRRSSGGSGHADTRYDVDVKDAANGTVKASSTGASEGATVTLTVTADEGYTLDKLTVTDKNDKEVKLTNKGDGKYTFTMPASDVTVEASFIEGSTLPFTDVSVNDWFYDAVRYMYENGCMNGLTDTTFGPDATTTRGMIVTMLYRHENEPTVAGENPFADVKDTQYYADAINWAAENDIVTGYDETTFGPDDTITREQMMAILYRYAQYKGYDVTASADLSAYTDAANISSYAVSAMQWAVGEGLINGITDTTLVPGGSATRAQVAAILMRFCENVAK